MENASKALIIVGAVLIAILLIGFGVMIMNNSTSQVSPDALNSQAAQTHNAQFNNYTGKTNSAAQIKQLMNIITSNNVTGKTADTPQKVYVYYIPQSTTTTGGKAAETGFYDPAKLSSTVRNGYTYTVEINNSNAVDVTNEDIQNEGDTPNDAKDEKTPSYYANGYLRTIVITENARGKGGSAST